MKDWILGIIAAALIIAAGAGIYLLSTQEEQKTEVAAQKVALDSAKVIKIVENYYNPEISSVGGAISIQNELIARLNYENVFIDIPQQVLIEVTSVLLKENPHKIITLKDVAKEYKSNERIYNNLPRKKVVGQELDKDSLYNQ